MEQNICERLIEERERLGLNKSEMALAGGVAKPTYLRYETGERSPDGLFWSRIHTSGADVLYILTGQRSQQVAPQELLPEGDRILLSNFHAAPDAVRAGVKTTLSAFASKGGERRGKKAA